jgi:hypothetical protein
MEPLREPTVVTGGYYLGRIWEVQELNKRLGELDDWFRRIASYSTVPLDHEGAFVRPEVRSSQPGFLIHAASGEIWLQWERCRSLMKYLQTWMCKTANGETPFVAQGPAVQSGRSEQPGTEP